MIYGLCLILFLVGFYGIVVKRNLIKIIMGLIIMEYAVHLFIVLVSYQRGGIVPILQEGQSISEFVQLAVDPLPQVLVLTAIIINFGITALVVAIAIRLYEKYETFDINEIRRLRG